MRGFLRKIINNKTFYFLPLSHSETELLCRRKISTYKYSFYFVCNLKHQLLKMSQHFQVGFVAFIYFYISIYYDNGLYIGLHKRVCSNSQIGCHLSVPTIVKKHVFKRDMKALKCKCHSLAHIKVFISFFHPIQYNVQRYRLINLLTL